MKQRAKISQSGISLVEMMVAITISLILLAGVIQIFLGSKQSYRLNENMSRIQESGRFAMEFLARDIRMIGYQGCASLDSVQPNIIADPPPVGGFSNDVVVTGMDNVSSLSIGGLPVRDGTDTVSIRRGGGCQARLSGNMTANNANIQLTADSSCYAAGDILFISDCKDVDIFRASNVSQAAGTITIAHASNVNTFNFLSKAYNTDAFVMRFTDFVYFVSGETLYRDDQPLVDGVVNMQILYGIDTDNDRVPNQYVSAGTVADWSSVVALRVSLLLAGPDNGVVTAAQTVFYDGINQVMPDQRLYRTFTNTVGIRNRLP
ncbi:PilW family protein [Sulfurivermis fontis]|uniref:PilW family protein n=1 Tax=Sulfurivermis fontis TaxID=1972068 RepID=UPI000FDA1986|nr:PilW family protein [Sulfurivermis fontis]